GSSGHRAERPAHRAGDPTNLIQVTLAKGAAVQQDPLVIAGRTFASRLIVGTGKFGSFEVMRDALDASGAEMVTVALRRVDLDATGGPDILEFVDAPRYLILPNTSGAVDADEALRIARLARAAGLPEWIE